MRISLLLLALSLLPGCRCSPSEDVLPASRAPEPDSRAACPALPAWAAGQGDDVELDLLHVSDTHGTGYRLLKNGTLRTWDDLDLVKDDAGRMKLDKGVGAWKERGPIAPERLRALRAAIDAADEAELAGARAGKGGKGNTRTHFLLWRNGRKHAFCYLGDNPPAGLEPIEKAVHALLKKD